MFISKQKLSELEYRLEQLKGNVDYKQIQIHNLEEKLSLQQKRFDQLFDFLAEELSFMAETEYTPCSFGGRGSFEKASPRTFAKTAIADPKILRTFKEDVKFDAKSYTALAGTDRNAGKGQETLGKAIKSKSPKAR